MQKSEYKQGKVVAISISNRKGIPKTNIDEALLITDYGIEGDAHSGKWHRQVSILSIENIKKMQDMGLMNLKPGSFAENITTEYLNISDFRIGSKLYIGDEIILEITQLGKTCHSKCEIYKTIGDCIMPKEGIFAKVLKGGIIKKGDFINLIY